MHLTVAVTRERFNCAPPGHVKWWKSNYSFSRVCTSTRAAARDDRIGRKFAAPSLSWTASSRRTVKNFGPNPRATSRSNAESLLVVFAFATESVRVLPKSREWAAIPGTAAPFAGAGPTQILSPTNVNFVIAEFLKSLIVLEGAQHSKRPASLRRQGRTLSLPWESGANQNS
jgi:hypothetical protein